MNHILYIYTTTSTTWYNHIQSYIYIYIYIQFVDRCFIIFIVTCAALNTTVLIRIGSGRVRVVDPPRSRGRLRLTFERPRSFEAMEIRGVGPKSHTLQSHMI